MCGIFCLLCTTEEGTTLENLETQFELFKDVIASRGPNSLQTEFIKLQTQNLIFAASVLWLQGKEMTTQPLKTQDELFIYNGDVFGGSEVNNAVTNVTGDTKYFFDLLRKSDNISQTISHIEGPYAFVYLNKSHNKLYFARDMYGRRSLLVGKNNNQIIITSVAKRETKFNFMELPCTGIFFIDLDTNKWHIFPWRRRNKNFREKINELEIFLNEDVIFEETSFEEGRSFSPPNEADLKILNEISIVSRENILSYICSLYLDKILELKELLLNSIKKRILTQPKFCKNCFKDYNCKHAITGVLFSGGVDCAILAILANEFIENKRPIDLINVAFEKDDSFDTPDRLTGMETFKELQNLCPDRKWNFVEVNVTRKELNSWRKERISDLIYPLETILDDSLGCALWFASRAETPDYSSPCRTLLVGMGADELFGGYTRHRAAFQKRSWEGLHQVLEEDWQNLPHRNLARDDRVVSDHGRQLRTPYLDEKVVQFVQNLNCWEKTFPSKDLPQGIGEKILLRSLAYHLGLKNAATFKKRALQFGSRIANSKEKGHQTAERLQIK